MSICSSLLEIGKGGTEINFNGRLIVIRSQVIWTKDSFIKGEVFDSVIV